MKLTKDTMTNKTPIQELVDWVSATNKMAENEDDGLRFLSVYALDLSSILLELLQKEKAFAFDCYEAGKAFGMDYSWSKQPNFEQFYSQYVPQHKQ